MFETFLMQSDIVESVGVIVGAIATIIGVVAAAWAKRVDSIAKSHGRQLTEAEKKQIADAEFTQLVAQKVQEEMARGKIVGRAVYHMATTPEQREIVERDVKPLVDTAGERIQTIADQSQFFTNVLETNVNQNENVPRESPQTLKVVNETVNKATGEV